MHPAGVCADPYFRFSDVDSPGDTAGGSEEDVEGRRQTRRPKAQEVGRNQVERKDCPSLPSLLTRKCFTRRLYCNGRFL
jgi:hypothetical protein